MQKVRTAMTDDIPDLDFDAEVPKWDEANDPDGYTRAELAPKDWTLSHVLDFTIGPRDDDEGSVGLTVVSGGVVVSGIAISEAEHNKILLQQLRDAGADETAQWVGKLLDKQIALVTTKREERVAADLPYAARRFLHMRDARIYHGDSWVNAPLWRGILADVSSWSLGTHKPAE